MSEPREPNQPLTLKATGAAIQSEVDDPRIAQAMEAYLGELELGRTPDHNEFLARFPEIAEELAGQLEGIDFLHALAPQVTRAAEKADNSDHLLADRVTLGDFRLIRQIGRGGMGVVYEADQLSLGRRVAVKVLPYAAMLDPLHRKRFHNEARAAATLDHPHIVPIYFVGQERGVHFFAMPLIEGQNLAHLIEELRSRESGEVLQHTAIEKRKHLPQEVETNIDFRSTISTQRSNASAAFYRTAARLGAEAAEALEHAHQLGILHRDIKPGNLLVDATGKLWVADFGLATVEHGEALTRTGGIVGTAAYMSPEQAADSRHIDGRSDVYSLGATLYELLTLQRYRSEEMTRAEPGRVLRAPVAPPTRFDRYVPNDLQTIVIKSLADNPDDRYQSAGEMSEDLRAFIDGREIKARRLTLWQRQSRFLRRHHRWFFAGLATVVLLVIGTAALALVYSRQLARHAKDLESALAEAKNARHAAEYQSFLARENEAKARQNEKRAVQSEIAARRMSYRSDMQRAFNDFGDNQFVTVDKLLDRQVPTTDINDVRGSEWKLLRSELNAKHKTLGWHTGEATECALFPDGQTVATAGEDGCIYLWDILTRRKTKTLKPKIGPIHALDVSPDGKTIAVGGKPSTSFFDQAAVYLLDAETGERKSKIQRHKTTIESIRFSPDGKLLAAGSRYEGVQLSTLEGRLLHLFENGQRNTSVEFSADSQQVIVIWDKPDLIRMFDCGSGDRSSLQFEPSDRVASMHWIAGHQLLVISGSRGSWVDVFDGETGKSIVGLAIPGSTTVPAVTASDDGQMVTAGTALGTVHQFPATPSEWRSTTVGRVTNAVQNPVIPPILSGDHAITGIAQAKDGTIVATHRSGRVQLSAPQATAAVVHSLDIAANCAVITEDSIVYLGSVDGRIIKHDIDSVAIETLNQRNRVQVVDIDINRQNDRLAAVYESGSISVIDPATSTVVWESESGHDGRGIVFRIAISNDGRYIARAGDNNRLTVWDIDADRCLLDEPRPGSGTAVAISNDGTVAGLGCEQFELFKVASAQLFKSVRTTRVHAIEFRRDDLYVATGHQNGMVRLIDLDSATEQSLSGHDSSVYGAVFASQGRTLFTVDQNAGAHTLRMWDVETASGYGRLSCPRMMVEDCLAIRRELFVGDQRAVLCAVGSPTKIAVWDLSTN